MGEQAGQLLAGPELLRYEPTAQPVHCESVAVVQVSALTQFATSEHSEQTVLGPALSTKRPDWHWVHRELLASAQVNDETQYVTLEHGGHVSATPSLRKFPLEQPEHCEFDAEVQVTPLVQFAMPVQVTHAPPDRYRPGTQEVHWFPVHVAHEGVHAASAEWDHTDAATTTIASSVRPIGAI